MKQAATYCSIVVLALAAQGALAQVAFAQFIPPGSSQFNPPPPAPPPPPKIEVPAIPQAGALPSRSYAPVKPRKSYGDRVTKCLDDAAAAGLGPNERATYSRNCATR